MGDTNSKRTRVEPVFRWLRDQGGPDWPSRLLHIAEGFTSPSSPGRVLKCECEVEAKVAPSPARLAWMIRNAARLAATDGRRWREYTRRIIENKHRDEALEKLHRGESAGVPRELILEGETHADCLITCEKSIIWIEGKRNDWLSSGIKWDIARDQLARNVEAAWISARDKGKDYWVIICHEMALKHHEEQLVRGYRAGTWNGGWPHVTQDQRMEFAKKIGTLTWARILDEWPALRSLTELRDVTSSR